MRIEMLKTMPGSPDGIKVNTYTKGEVYDVPSADMPEELAEVFLTEKLAKETRKKAAEGEE